MSQALADGNNNSSNSSQTEQIDIQNQSQQQPLHIVTMFKEPRKFLKSDLPKFDDANPDKFFEAFNQLEMFIAVNGFNYIKTNEPFLPPVKPQCYDQLVNNTLVELTNIQKQQIDVFRHDLRVYDKLVQMGFRVMFDSLSDSLKSDVVHQLSSGNLIDSARYIYTFIRQRYTSEIAYQMVKINSAITNFMLVDNEEDLNILLNSFNIIRNRIHVLNAQTMLPDSTLLAHLETKLDRVGLSHYQKLVRDNMNLSFFSSVKFIKS